MIRAVFLAALLLSTSFSNAEEASAALKRAVEFFSKKVAVNGTYLWNYSEDLSKREGETAATGTQGWVQPPGTPAVGAAILEAYEATGDKFYLEGARETAMGLIKGQLRSGGWTYPIDFSEEGRKRFAYRDGGGAKGRNTTTFDDDTTQAALRFLMRMDRALNYSDAKIHEAVEFCFSAIFSAQYPNGAWPQGYEHFPEPGKFPVKRAAYPESWAREWPGSLAYWLRYTLNDNNHATLIDTLIEATEIYKGEELGAAARRSIGKAGEFIFLAQMPEPQPGWAQQYDFGMQPSWARKFEPPAVSAGESQGIIRALFKLHNFTGDAKYLEPVPRAIEWLKRSRLADGRLARFYELKTNKPLFFTKDYKLTYDDSDAPTHYAFKVSDSTAALERELEALKTNGPRKPKSESAPDAAEIKRIIAALDAQGRWVEDGKLKSDATVTRVIRAATFNRNVTALARHLKSSP